MKFDMHCHSKEGSMDGKVRMKQIIERLKSKGFGGMMIADHNSYSGYRVWERAEERKGCEGFVVLKGIEYDTIDGGHFLVIMPEECNLRILELRGLTIESLLQIVHRYGGILGPAHPFGEKYMSLIATQRGNPQRIQKLTSWIQQCDFIEIFNSCEPESSNEKARRLAKRFKKPGFGGSDAHKADCIGLGYTILPDEIRTESDLIAYVKTKPEILCGGIRYGKTTKDRLGQWNRLLVHSFPIYNRGISKIRGRKRRLEMKKMEK